MKGTAWESSASGVSARIKKRAETRLYYHLFLFLIPCVDATCCSVEQYILIMFILKCRSFARISDAATIYSKAVDLLRVGIITQTEIKCFAVTNG